MRQSWLDFGVNPTTQRIRKLSKVYFSREGLEYVDPSSAVGDQLFWHDVETLFRMPEKATDKRLKHLKNSVSQANGKETVAALHRNIRDYMLIKLASYNLKVYADEIAYQYGDEATRLIDSAKTIIDSYNQKDAMPHLDDEQVNCLNQLAALVNRYKSDPLQAELSNFFSIAFSGSRQSTRAQAKRLNDKGFLERCNIDEAWLYRVFPAERAGEEVEISVSTLNRFLLYVLTVPQSKWVDRTREVLAVCVNYIKYRLGIDEGVALQRRLHNELKQASYPDKLVKVLELLSTVSEDHALTIEEFESILTFADTHNFLGALDHAIRFKPTAVDAQEAVKQLLDKSVNKAAYKGSYQCFLRLVREVGRDINALCDDGLTLLGYAVAYNREKLVEVLLSYDEINVDAKDDLGRTPLLTAIEHRNMTMIRLLLEAHADVNQKDRHDFSSLMHAVRIGNTNMASILLEAGADVNLPNRIKHTPLILAVLNSNEDMVQLLLNKRANTEYKINDGATALMLAVCNKELSIAKMLLEAGAKINAQDDTHNTPLHYAVASGSEEVVRLLLDKGANPNSILLEAIQQNDLGIVKLLVDAGVNPNLIDGDGTSALHYAVMINALDCMRALLSSREINADAVDTAGTTALMQAIYQNNSDAIRCLVESGANVNLLDKRNTTPLIQAVQIDCNESMVELLLGLGAKTEIKYGAGYSSLMLAVSRKKISTVKILLEGGANINTRNDDHLTPLIFALLSGDDDMAQLLLERGANPNLADKDGMTALMHAVKTNNPKMVALLLAHEAINIYETNREGKTALQIAISSGNRLQCMELLLEKPGVTSLETWEGKGSLTDMLQKPCCAGLSIFHAVDVGEDEAKGCEASSANKPSAASSG